jgi:Fic family protein
LLETGRVELEGIITQQFFKKILGDSTTKKTEVSVTKDKKGNVVSTTTKQTITEAPPSDALLLAVMQKVCNWENEGEDEENVITVTTTPTNTKSMQDIVAELKKMKYAKGMG